MWHARASATRVACGVPELTLLLRPSTQMLITRTVPAHLAKVLTGETYRSHPNRDLKKPPVKPHSAETFVDELYDSVSGNTKDTDIFIIYDHEKAYPEYLITYDTSGIFGLF